MIRSAGILMPITALPADHGVGTFGSAARDFVDFLVEAGQTWWQILPLGPTGYGNSPYQPLSSFAGNPYLISLDDLVEEGYLEKEDLVEMEDVEDPGCVDYGMLYNKKMAVLKKAADHMPFVKPSDYDAFLTENGFWLKEYAIFMAIKEEHNGKAWQDWPEELKDHRSEQVQNLIAVLHENISRHERIQYFFFRQAKALKKYANDRGIRLIGDLPFYVAADSIDVWSHPEQFDLDEHHEIKMVAGMPGQKWGNPLFNWEKMKEDGYSWWIERARFQYSLCDEMRLDHFRGFMSYYAIDKDSEDAWSGQWHEGPGLSVLQKMEELYGKYEMIVEDLGELTKEFTDMVKESGYPGMKILQYAFDPNDPGSYYMPFQYDDHNAVVYTGTHDNNTLQGWMKNEPGRVKRAAQYLYCDEENVDLALMRCGYASVCDLAVVQMQDLLRLDESARINDPSGGANNWCWRMQKEDVDEDLAHNLADLMKLYCRYNWIADEKKRELSAMKA